MHLDLTPVDFSRQLRRQRRRRLFTGMVLLASLALVMAGLQSWRSYTMTHSEVGQMQTQLRSLRAATTAWQRAQETARALDTRRQHIQSLQRSLSLQYMSEIFERLPDAAKLHWLRIEMHSQHRVLTTLEGSALTTVAALHFRDQLHQLGQASLDQTASDFGRDEPVFVLRLESND